MPNTHGLDQNISRSGQIRGFPSSADRFLLLSVMASCVTSEHDSHRECGCVDNVACIELQHTVIVCITWRAQTAGNGEELTRACCNSLECRSIPAMNIHPQTCTMKASRHSTCQCKWYKQGLSLASPRLLGCLLLSDTRD